MQKVITKPAFEQVTTIQTLAGFILFEIMDSRSKQNDLFQAAMKSTNDPFAYFDTKALVTKMEALHSQEQDLVKYLKRVHYFAMEQLDVIFPIPQVAWAA